MNPQASSRRLALVLEYDGGGFSGSQLQKNAATIQGELEAALRKLTQAPLRVALAGRTDAGVHAKCQVAAFTTTSTLETGVFVRGLNALLPQQIAVRRALEAPDRFDPRRHARRRTYRYTIYNAPVRSPIWAARAWHVAEHLDAQAMQDAADALVGDHDFAAFSRREGVHTVRRVERASVKRWGPLVMLDVRANAFVRQQMRRTAGALVEVGAGRQEAAGFRELLNQAEPSSAGPMAPPHGLCLMKVEYAGLDLAAPNTLSCDLAGR